MCTFFIDYLLKFVVPIIFHPVYSDITAMCTTSMILILADEVDYPVILKRTAKTVYRRIQSRSISPCDPRSVCWCLNLQRPCCPLPVYFLILLCWGRFWPAVTNKRQEKANFSRANICLGLLLWKVRMEGVDLVSAACVELKGVIKFCRLDEAFPPKIVLNSFKKYIDVQINNTKRHLLSLWIVEYQDNQSWFVLKEVFLTSFRQRFTKRSASPAVKRPPPRGGGLIGEKQP